MLLAKALQHPADFGKVARMVGARPQVQFATATAKVRHGIAQPVATGKVGKGMGVMAGRRALKAVEQDQQGLVAAILTVDSGAKLGR